MAEMQRNSSSGADAAASRNFFVGCR